MKVMEQRPNQSAGPRDVYPDWLRGCRLCTRQCCLCSGLVGFENKCHRVGSDSGLISSGLSRVGSSRILGPEKTSSADTWCLLCLLCKSTITSIETSLAVQTASGSGNGTSEQDHYKAKPPEPVESLPIPQHGNVATTTFLQAQD